MTVGSRELGGVALLATHIRLPPHHTKCVGVKGEIFRALEVRCAALVKKMLDQTNRSICDEYAWCFVLMVLEYFCPLTMIECDDYSLPQGKIGVLVRGEKNCDC